jgi:hypothetical protein
MLNGWGVSASQPPHGRENVRNPFRSHDDSWIQRHEKDIQNIRAVNRQRYRAFRDRFRKVEDKIALLQTDVDQARIANTISFAHVNAAARGDRQVFDQKLGWQNDALQEQVNDLTERLNIQRESIDVIMQILSIASDINTSTGELLEQSQQKDEALRRALNRTSETLMEFMRKHGDDEDREQLVGIVGDAAQDGQGLNADIFEAIRRGGGTHVPTGLAADTEQVILEMQDTELPDDDDIVIPEEIQAFIDFLKDHAPEGTEVEVIGAAQLPNRDQWEDDGGPVLVSEPGDGNHYEYDATEARGIGQDGVQHSMKIQTLESWRRNGPQNPADAIINSVRDANAKRVEGLATTDGDQMRVLGPAKRID